MWRPLRLEKRRFQAHILAVTKLWQKYLKARLVSYVWIIFFVAMILYAAIRLGSVPFHPCGSGFCDKYGHPETAAKYHEFLVWQDTLLGVWVFAVGLSFLVRARRNQ